MREGGGCNKVPHLCVLQMMLHYGRGTKSELLDLCCGRMDLRCETMGKGGGRV